MKIKVLVVAAALITAAIGIYDMIANKGMLFVEYARSFFPN